LFEKKRERERERDEEARMLDTQIIFKTNVNEAM